VTIGFVISVRLTSVHLCAWNKVFAIWTDLILCDIWKIYVEASCLNKI